MSSLQFDSAYWELHLGDSMQKAELQTKLQLIFSLVMFLGVSVRQLINFIFSSDIQDVKNRAARFMGHTPTATDTDQRFPPATVFNLWHSRWPHVRHLLHGMIQPCAHEIVLDESDRIIRDPTLQIRIKSLTIKDIRELLSPATLVEKFKGSAPFMFDLLHTFAASPNKYRKQRATQQRQSRTGDSMEGAEDADWEDDPNVDENGADSKQPSSDWTKEYEGFSRNPIFVCLISGCYTLYNN
jgi:hypothetical protein